MRKMQRLEQVSNSTMFMSPKIVPMHIVYVLLPTVAHALKLLDEYKSFTQNYHDLIILII